MVAAEVTPEIFQRESSGLQRKPLLLYDSTSRNEGPALISLENAVLLSIRMSHKIFCLIGFVICQEPWTASDVSIRSSSLSSASKILCRFIAFHDHKAGLFSLLDKSLSNYSIFSAYLQRVKTCTP